MLTTTKADFANKTFQCDRSLQALLSFTPPHGFFGIYLRYSQTPVIYLDLHPSSDILASNADVRRGDHSPPHSIIVYS